MSTPSLALGRPTLADRLFTRRLVTDIVLVAAGAGLTSILAQIAIPIWPVPITMQTFGVLIVGATLGATRGAISLAIYALIGVLGLPVFAANADGTHTTGIAAILGATGGYIVGFILAAAIVGWLAQRKWDHQWLKTIVAFVIGTLVIYAIGLPWLYVHIQAYPAPVMIKYFGTDSALQATLTAGLVPFLIGDALKALLAGLLLPLTWRAIGNHKPSGS